MAKAAEVVLQLSAQNAQYLAKLRESTAAYNRSMLAIQRQAGVTSAYVRAAMAGIFAGATISGAASLLDASTRIENALKVAGLAGDDLARVYDRLFQSAQRNAVPLEGLVELFSRVSLVQAELGVSSDQIAQLTDNVGKALRVTGADAAAASGALLQLAQALGGGVIQAQEYNSLIDGLPGVLQAAAAGLEEAGGSVAKLTRLVKDGQITSQVFFAAIEAGADVLDDKLAGSELTVSQGFVRLQNVLIDTAGELDEGSDASRRMAGSLELLSDWIANIDFSPLIDNVVDFGRHVAGVITTISELADAAGKATGVQDFVRSRLGDRREQDTIQSRIDGAFAADPRDERKPTEVTVTKPRRTVSKNSYAPPKLSKGGGKGARERADEYERLTQRVAESTAALVAETEAQRQLNPLIDDYGYAVERARLEQELLTSAKAAGKEVTPALRAEIAALADQYALATVEAARLSETQEDVRQAAEEAAQFNKDLARGIVDGFLEGKKAADIFADALRNVGSRLLDLAFDGAFDSKSVGGGGWLSGLLGSLFGGGSGTKYASGIKSGQYVGLFHSGGVVGSSRVGRQVNPSVFAGAERYHNGGMPGLRSDEVPAILQKGEIVLPKNVVAGGGRGAAPSIVYAPINTFHGTSEEVAAFRREAARDRAEFSGKVVQTVRGAQKRRMLGS